MGIRHLFRGVVLTKRGNGVEMKSVELNRAPREIAGAGGNL